MPSHELEFGEHTLPGDRGRARVLVLAEALPYPTLKGGDLRTWQNVNALAAFADVGVFGLCSNDGRRERPPAIPLAFWTSSTDPALAYPPPKGVRLAARAWLLDPHGHPADLYHSAQAAREIAAVLEEFRPDVVIVEGLWLHAYIDLVKAAGSACVLDCHNVEVALFRELARARTSDDLESRLIRDVIPARTESIERRAVHAVDQLWACSREDERRLIDLYSPGASIHIVPNTVRLPDGAEGAQGSGSAGEQGATGERPRATRAGTREDSLTLLFMGFYPHAPNTIAAEFLVRDVFPQLVAFCPDARLLLVGARPPESLRAAALRDPRIIVTGALRDIGSALAQATALVVPLVQGGGTRLKVLEAFAAGVPVISTRKGVEGLDVVHGDHVLIAEAPAEFVDAALAVWRDSSFAARIAGNALALVRERYSWEAAGGRIRDALAALMVAR